MGAPPGGPQHGTVARCPDCGRHQKYGMLCEHCSGYEPSPTSISSPNPPATHAPDQAFDTGASEQGVTPKVDKAEHSPKTPPLPDTSR